MSKIFDLALQKDHALATRLFERAVSTGKLAHAYLLTGAAAADKWRFALSLAAHLNCSKRAPGAGTDVSCLVGLDDTNSWCTNCQWLVARQHPGALYLLDGEGRSGKVPVEKVRTLALELGKVSSFARVIIVPDAGESIFHRAAANALLKSIEEPPPRTVYFLFAATTEQVLSTVLSRCQVVPVHSRTRFGYEIVVCDQNRLPKDLLKETMQTVATSQERFLDAAKTSGRRPYWQSVSDAQGLSEALLGAAESLAGASAEVLDREDACAAVLDMLVARELERYSGAAAGQPALAAYLSRLINAVDEAKQQIKQYVKPASVFESFCLALFALRARHSGELTLAKR